MFKKLLKHDFKNIKKFGIPILLTLLGASVLGSLNAVILTKAFDSMTEESGIFATISMMSSFFMMMFVFLIISLAAAAIQIAVLVDFYRSLVSDIGYLTFTLPIKPSEILTSKLVTATVWTVIIGVACFISGGAIFGTIAIFNPTFAPTPGDLPPLGANGVILVILAIIFALAYFINSQLLCFAAIFFASVIARKNKVLAAIGCVYGVNFIYGIFSSVIFTVIMFAAEAVATVTDFYISYNIFLSIGIVLLSGLSVLFYFLTKYMMEKKLNLP